MEYIIGVIIAAVLACVPANMADKKGYSFPLFWCLSFFFSFIIVLIVVACLKDKYYTPQYYPAPAYAAPPPAYGTRCRHCGTYINYGDVFCRQCGTDQAKADAVSQPALGTRCKRCGSYIDEEEVFCRKCGAKQTSDDAGSPDVSPAEPEVKSYRVRNLPVSSLGFISCPNCGERQRVDRNECLKCGAKFLQY